MTYKNTFIGFAALMLTGVALWTSFLSSYNPRPASDLAQANLPDAFMEDMVAVILDQYGKPSMKIQAPKMLHFAENDTSVLYMPHLTLYQKSSLPWYITAKHAKSIRGIEKVDFWDDVLVQHPADPRNPATIIKTPTLSVYPDTQIAETSDAITMIQPNIMVNSIGMHADMNKGNIKLLSQARGEYVPSK